MQISAHTEPGREVYLLCVYVFVFIGPETASHSEAHDVEETEGGRGEEPGAQRGDHHRGMAVVSSFTPELGSRSQHVFKRTVHV